MKAEPVRTVTWRNAKGWCWSLQDAFGTSILRSRCAYFNERRARAAARAAAKYLPRAYTFRNKP